MTEYETDVVDVPFGFDESEDAEPIENPPGTWDFVVGRKTNAAVSKSSGNPMIELHARCTNPNDGERYWPVKAWFTLRGRGSGMIKSFLKALGHDPDEWIRNAQDQYRQTGGGADAQEVVDFFNREIVPQLHGTGFQGRVFHEDAKDRDTGETIHREDGSVVKNIRLTDYAPLA